MSLAARPADVWQCYWYPGCDLDEKCSVCGVSRRFGGYCEDQLYHSFLSPTHWETHMNLEEYTSAVECGEYPVSPLVPEGDKFENDNGVIRNLLFKSVRSVALITSKKGSIRSNHYHKTDWHYLYVLSGYVMYLWRRVGSERPPARLIAHEGSMLFTPPGVEHAVLSLSDSRLISLARNARTHEAHEADVVRVNVLDREIADPIVRTYG
jgi:quercetin dioxygenase-like cupin family protein